MTINDDKQLAQRMLETDQPVRVDAQRLTSNLVRLKRQKRYTNRFRCAAAAILFGAAFAAVFSSNARKENPQTASTISAGDDYLSLTPTDFELPFISMEERAKLERLKESVAVLRRQIEAQRFTIVKESISKSFFDDIVSKQDKFN